MWTYAAIVYVHVEICKTADGLISIILKYI